MSKPLYDNIVEHDTRLTKALRGIMHTTDTHPEPEDATEMMIFFTRTKMNLSEHQLMRDSQLASLLVKNKMSVETYVRLMLDPKLAYEDVVFKDNKRTKTRIESGLVDNTNGFIPILSNSVQNLTGFGDIALKVKSSKKGIRGETWSYIDSHTQQYGDFTLNATFRSDVGRTTKKLIHIWLLYAAAVRGGTIIPRASEMVGGRIDYQTGIYILVLDKTKRIILEWAKTIGFPIVYPSGEIFNFTKDKGKIMEFNTLFSCVGLEYNDPQILMDFNKVQQAFNPSLFIKEGQTKHSEEFYELSNDMLEDFEGESIPYIDLKYNTLEWVVPKTMLKKKEI